VRRAVVTSIVAGLWLPACELEAPPLIDDLFTDAEWQQLQTFTPLPPPPPSPTNRFADDPRAAAFGQRLWFEGRFAGPLLEGGSPELARVSCADCHDPTHWFTDTRSSPNRTSFGSGWTRRNSPSIVNAVYYEWTGWGGVHDQVWKQAATSPRTARRSTATACTSRT
jgi:cytochrome c peroxidase